MGISSCRIYSVDGKLSPELSPEGKLSPELSPEGGAARRRKELKFSWDDRVKHEDWGIQKVIIIDCDDGDGDGDGYSDNGDEHNEYEDWGIALCDC